MARVTFTQINNLVQNNLQKNYAKLSHSQELLSSGRRIQRPSDAPSEVTNDLQLRSTLKQLEQFERNINDGKNYLAIIESTMVSTNELYQRTRELSLQGSNDTNTDVEREYMLREVKVILEQMVSISNTNYRGSFIFSGTETDAQPFDLIGGGDVIDNIDNTVADNTDTFLSPGDTLPKEIQIWDRGVSDSNTLTGHARVRDIIPSSLTIPGLDEGIDYSIDYVEGTITFLAAPTVAIPGVGNLTKSQIQAANAGSFPGWPPPGDPAWGVSPTQPQPGGGIEMNYNWIRRNEKDLDGQIMREIEQGLVGQINTTASEVFGDNSETTSWDAMVKVMEGLYENDQIKIREAVSDINVALERTLSAQATAGARANRFSMTQDRNDASYIETTRLQSKIEDVDFAKVISEFVLQENVYTASLQSAARVIQPSLGNYL